VALVMLLMQEVVLIHLVEAVMLQMQEVVQIH